MCGSGCDYKEKALIKNGISKTRHNIKKQERIRFECALFLQAVSISKKKGGICGKSSKKQNPLNVNVQSSNKTLNAVRLRVLPGVKATVRQLYERGTFRSGKK